jgi:hypothetical protein
MFLWQRMTRLPWELRILPHGSLKRKQGLEELLSSTTRISRLKLKLRGLIVIKLKIRSAHPDLAAQEVSRVSWGLQLVGLRVRGKKVFAAEGNERLH